MSMSSRYYTYLDVPAWIISRFAEMAPKDTYINQLELLAAVVVYRTFPDLLRGRLVHHFIDNDAARCALIKGYSGRPDSAMLVGLMHETLMSLASYPWFGFVYSEDNGSDGPSRADFSLSRQLGGEWRSTVLPGSLEFY